MQNEKLINILISHGILWDTRQTSTDSSLSYQIYISWNTSPINFWFILNQDKWFSYSRLNKTILSMWVGSQGLGSRWNVARLLVHYLSICDTTYVQTRNFFWKYLSRTKIFYKDHRYWNNFEIDRLPWRHFLADMQIAYEFCSVYGTDVFKNCLWLSLVFHTKQFLRFQ